MQLQEGLDITVYLDPELSSLVLDMELKLYWLLS